MTQHGAHRVLAALLLSGAVIGCNGADETLGAAPAKDAAALTDAPLSGTVPTPAELARRRQALRAHFQGKVEALHRVATTVTSNGTVIDWIRPESQGPTSKPPEAPPSKCGGGLAQCAQTELEVEPGARGPAGTVPVPRFDVEGYLATVAVPPENPEDLFRKLPPPSPASNNRYYVSFEHSGTYYGSAGAINVWDAEGPEQSSETDIAQVALFTRSGSLGESVEAGKIECANLNGGSYAPYLFTWFTTNNWGASGDWVGGYNQLVQGWHQVSSTKAPGVRLQPVSTDGSQQYEIKLEVRRNDAGDWWVWMNDEWIGYYPHCKQERADCSAGSTFTSAGMQDHASNIYWYGEIYDASAPSATATDMGSGQFASAWWQHAAYIRNMTYFWGLTNYWWFDATPSLNVTDSACYTGAGPYTDSSSTDWKNFFFFGGPGRGAAGCF